MLHPPVTLRVAGSGLKSTSPEREGAAASARNMIIGAKTTVMSRMPHNKIGLLKILELLQFMIFPPL
jgi:hypothetical protein